MTEQSVAPASSRYLPWAAMLGRLVLGVLWLWAAVPKLHDPRAFVQAVRAFDATPEWLSQAIAFGAPVLEFSLGLLLVVGILVRLAAVTSAVLLAVYLVGLVEAAARSLPITCGCFGGGGPTTGATSHGLEILRDVVLLAIAVGLVLRPLTMLSLEQFLARHDRVEMPSAKRMRTPEGRRRYEAELAAVRGRARSRTLYLTSALSLVIALVTVIGIGVQKNRAAFSLTSTPIHATLANGVVDGKAAGATVDIYEDFACAECGAFERSVATRLGQAVSANLVQVRYHPLGLLDGPSGGYSTRAAAAALCASDSSVADFVALHDLLFSSALQPAPGVVGPSNVRLVADGRTARIADASFASYSSCVDSGTYVPYVQALTDRASQDHIITVPRVTVNGHGLPSLTPGALFAAITAADKGFTPHPTPTPSASPSPSGPASSGAPGGAPAGTGSSGAPGTPGGPGSASDTALPGPGGLPLPLPSPTASASS